MPSPTPLRSRPATRLAMLALAYAGGVIGYLPLLTMLLPVKVEQLAGEARLNVLTAIVVGGALVASGSNLLFGWLSDRSHARGQGRRRWMIAGLAGLVVAYAVLAVAVRPPALIVGVVLFQLGVNAVLAPLMAIMAEETSDAHKGTLGGLLAFANPLAAGYSTLLIAGGVRDPAARMMLVPAAVGLCVAPLLIGGRLPVQDQPGSRDAGRPRDLAVAWVARLMVQVAGNVLFPFLLYYFETVAPGLAADTSAARVGNLLILSYLLPLPVAVVAGRLFDRRPWRKPILLAVAGIAALGLVGMAAARDWTTGAIAFGVYAVGSGVFLALHAGFSMQLLPSPDHRGRDLGLVNLANTLPALAGPLLAWLLASPRDFTALLLVLAGITLAGGMVLLAARVPAQRGQ